MTTPNATFGISPQLEGTEHHRAVRDDRHERDAGEDTPPHRLVIVVAPAKPRPLSLRR